MFHSQPEFVFHARHERLPRHLYRDVCLKTKFVVSEYVHLEVMSVDQKKLDLSLAIETMAT